MCTCVCATIMNIVYPHTWVACNNNRLEKVQVSIVVYTGMVAVQAMWFKTQLYTELG